MKFTVVILASFTATSMAMFAIPGNLRGRQSTCARGGGGSASELVCCETIKGKGCICQSEAGCCDEDCDTSPIDKRHNEVEAVVVA
ncbi:hypothetical protein FMUND_13538 [Fusarium mundagurra]|uniref:Uncharacterized protein n=1 Tax=Fusarium mundagurra TaxID=1567541 RepID=A0A8H5XYC6_9HYPO|nr:hypothetical protein FMUND_13538 [Fusarium mundagurra]